jgi:prophage DNA circulation protein
MADIDGLKQRIELIDLRLSTAHSARERESAALVDMWEQIRDRLQGQNKEILTLRDRIKALEDTGEDLQNMVDNLLGAVEGGLERMSDETVPNIREMASELLNETKASTPFQQEIPPIGQNPFVFDSARTEHADPIDNDEIEDDDFLASLERSSNTTTNSGPSVKSEGDNVLTLDTPIDTPVSTGIQALVARIEDSVGGPVADNTDTGSANVQDTTPSSDGLQQDLQEIEQLRNELLGLRERIS